jgi:hypothetical protein
MSQALSIVGVVVAYGVGLLEEGEDPGILATALLQIPLWAGLAGTVLWASRAKGNGLAEDFGFTFRPVDVAIGIPVGLVTQLVVVPLIYLPLLPLLGRSTEELEEPARKLAERADSPTGWVVFALIVVVAAPLVEELFYRGLVLRSLTKSGLPNWVVVVLSAALFAAMHLQALQFAGLFAFGVVLAVLALRTGRLAAPIVAHMAFNAVTVVVLWNHR